MLKYLSKGKGFLFLGTLFSVIATVAQATIPYLSKFLFDYGFGGEFQTILWLILAYLVCAAVISLGQYLSLLFQWKLIRRFNINLKAALVKGIFRHTVPDFQKKSIGDYLSILTNDTMALMSDWLDPLLDIVNFSLTLVVYAVFLFVFVDFRIATVILLASLLAVFLPKITAKELSSRRKQELGEMETYTSKVKDLLEGFKFLNRRSFEPMAKEHEEYLKKAENCRYRRGAFYSFTLNINGFVLNIINLSAFAAVAVLLFQGEITVGTGVATLGYIESFLIPIQYIVESINAIVSTKEVKEKVLSYTEYRPALQQELPAHAWPLDLEGVTVEYDGFSLRNFSYTFRPGKKYAVIGHNGSGKSTLFHAILKYAPLSQGEVRLGTYDAKDYDVSKVMADVCQHEHMFAVPYEKNVTLFGAYSAEKLPEIEGELQGDTLDMVRGSADCTTLSGGQQQLVHLIRLLLSDHPVLLLDEPFSAMDKANRDQLQEKLLRMPGKTILVITHDLTPEHLALYDEVLILRDGRLCFAGSPEQAVAEMGNYI